MDEIVYWFKKITNLLKAAIYLAATVIAAIPFLAVDTKIYWIVILGLILFIIAPREAEKFISKRSRNIILGYVFWVILVMLITEVIIPTLQSI